MPREFCRGRRYFRQRPQRVYEFNDEFQVPDANPLSATPRICEPGPGTLYWRDLDGQLSVNFGALTFAGGSAGWDRTFLHTETQTWARKAGRFIEFELTPLSTNYMRIGWQKGSTGFIADNLAMLYFSGSGNIEVIDDLDVMSVAYPYTAGAVSYKGRIVDTGTGFLYYIREGVSDEWTLLWHKPLSRSGLDSIRLAVQSIDMLATMQWLRIGSAPLRPPSVIRAGNAGERFCAKADFLADAHFTVPASGAPGLLYRYTDPDNYWRAEVNKTAGELRLVKREAGVETTEDTYADEPVTGDTCRLRVLTFGDEHRVYTGQTLLMSVSDSFNADAETIGLLSGATYTHLRCDTGGSLPS